MTRICRAAYLWASMILLVLGTGSSWNRDLGPLVVPEQYSGWNQPSDSPPPFGGWTFKTTLSWH